MPRKARKGQIALEFLITYGWAIFIVTGALAALAYFGVFNLDQFLVEKCIFSSGVVCVDHVQNDDGVTIVIQNAMGVTIENISLTLPSCSDTPILLPSLDSGSQSTFVDSCVLAPDDPFKSTLILNYTNPESGLEHIKRGEVVGKVQ